MTTQATRARGAASELEPQQREELERIAAGAAEVAKLLNDLSAEGLEGALKVVAAARYQLDLTERQLVRLARLAGRSWAQIGVELGIISGQSTHKRFASGE